MAEKITQLHPELSAFDLAFRDLIDLEGGFVDHPMDKGGPTKWGISQRSYPKVDIKALTPEEAKAIYLADYWQKLSLDSLTFYGVKRELFEQGVNLGVDKAARHAQWACKLLGEPCVIDGTIGPKTIETLEKVSGANLNALIKVLNGLQFSYYVGLVSKNPTQQVFLVGWLRRVDFTKA